MRALDRKTRAVLREFGAHEAATSVERMYLHTGHHVDQADLIPKEQKALRKGRRGCLDAM